MLLVMPQVPRMLELVHVLCPGAGRALSKWRAELSINWGVLGNNANVSQMLARTKDLEPGKGGMGKQNQ